MCTGPTLGVAPPRRRGRRLHPQGSEQDPQVSGECDAINLRRAGTPCPAVRALAPSLLQPGDMKLRAAGLGGVAVGVIGFAIWLVRAPAEAPSAAGSHAARGTTRGTQPALEASATPAARPKMVLTESGWRPQTTNAKPR